MTIPDLTSEYFQMVLEPKEILETAFVSNNVTRGFARLPLWLSGALASFGKLMNKVLESA